MFSLIFPALASEEAGYFVWHMFDIISSFHDFLQRLNFVFQSATKVTADKLMGLGQMKLFQ
jgi:hypothetical protein